MEQVRLVFLTDARAKYDGNVETDEELDWVAVAREGLRRGYTEGGFKGMEGLDTVPLLMEKNRAQQHELYRYMCELRDGGTPLQISPARYAIQVAHGEIYLPPRSSEFVA